MDCQESHNQYVNHSVGQKENLDEHNKSRLLFFSHCVRQSGVWVQMIKKFKEYNKLSLAPRMIFLKKLSMLKKGLKI